ncbi:hypothetical protein G9A89_009970 [Geosiphon pyriformis]|nr:hypothetical protein G9A89_009970 [Geosiphon pyriformis]
MKNQHQQPHPKVAESENIEANHLRFTKSLFQHYSKSAFNFYVNKRIAYLLGISMNIKSVKETFYNKLIQNTSLFTNHNFASIITEINKEIEHHTQQRYPITYTSKGKGKLQTPAKTRVKSPNNLSYHYTLGSAINISLTDVSTLNATSAIGCFPFQSKQRKENLLGSYSNSWEITESEGKQEVEKEKKSEDQEFTYQNPILENLEIETLNFQTQPNLDNQKNNTPNIQTLSNQNYLNPEVINQYLLPVIVINQPPVEPIGQPIQPPNQQNQQLPPVPTQQQQLLPPQQQQMAYVPIVKLDKFNSKKDDTQVWLNNVVKAITANNWDNAKAIQAIFYFLQNTAEDTEVVTIYLGLTPENATSSNQRIKQQQLPTNNISPATITKNESLDAIFSFKLEEPSDMPLFSKAILEKKPIMVMYTDTKIDGHSIKLNLDTASTRIVTANKATKTPLGEIDDFSIEVNSTIVPIKVLVIEATQYQALVNNDWLSKTNAVFNWMTQELVLSQNEAYQVSWANDKYNKLPPILLWNDNGKKKQKETELTWNADQVWDTDHNLEELPSWKWDKREKGKGKAKEEEPLPTASYTLYTDILPQLSSYCQPKLICINYGKKLSSIGAYCGDNKEYQTATKFYCCACLVKCFGRPK